MIYAAGSNSLVMMFEVGGGIASSYSDYRWAVFATGAVQFFYAVVPTYLSGNLLTVPLIPLTITSVIGLAISVSYANTSYYSLINSDPFGLPACESVLIPPSLPPSNPLSPVNSQPSQPGSPYIPPPLQPSSVPGER